VATDRKGSGAQQPFGPFVLERRIAVGGSAEVFLARPKIGIQPAARLVVKKLLRAAREGGDFDALEREAALHRAVVHRNVVNVFGAGMVGDEPYLAMEYVEGVDLYRLLRRADAELRRFPPGLAAFIAMRVASALSAVHTAHDLEGNALHIVHRDVTPSNIYLSIDGQIKLGDFGIARFEQRVKPAQPSVGLKGKFGYLAPEQVAGEPFDHRADLFALTAVFGEMLIGERVFPGSGQLAVLLAIRDVNIGPLRQAAGSLPEGVLELCEKGLARDPDARFQDAAELAAALSEFEQPSPEELQVTLAEWVNWAKDSSQLARQIEGQVRDSVQRMRAVRARSSGGMAAVRESPISEPPPTLSLSNVRRSDGQTFTGVTFPKLIEMIATGDLTADDEVSLMGQEYRFIRDIHELGRHLLPSTTATTSRLFEPGIPDYQVLLKDTPMLDVLAYMRQKGESGALFVERGGGSGSGSNSNSGSSRKEIYLDKGRLLHVASSEREELLGEYLVRRGRLTREQLETALGTLSNYGGRLGDTLIGIGMVDAVDVFRAIRDQGRDRVATLCGWFEGLVTFYRGTAPQRVEFPLDLDLASPMMAGAIVRAKGEPKTLLPEGKRLLPGPRAEAVRHPRERGSAPASLIYVSTLTPERPTIEQALERLMSYRTGHEARAVGAKEAAAALVTAERLGWVIWGE